MSEDRNVQSGSRPRLGLEENKASDKPVLMPYYSRELAARQMKIDQLRSQKTTQVASDTLESRYAYEYLVYC